MTDDQAAGMFAWNATIRQLTEQHNNGEETQMDKAKIARKRFVTRLGGLLNMAKPNLVSCHLATGAEILTGHEDEQFFTELHPFIHKDEEEWAVITCENGHQYFINVTGDSLASIATEVFSKMVYK